MAPRNASFSDGFYSYNHEQRKKDLEYHRLDPENNPVKPAEHYFEEGPLLKVWKSMNASNEQTPVLEIRNVHRADENLIVRIGAVEMGLRHGSRSSNQYDSVFVRLPITGRSRDYLSAVSDGDDTEGRCRVRQATQINGAPVKSPKPRTAQVIRPRSWVATSLPKCARSPPRATT